MKDTVQGSVTFPGRCTDYDPVEKTGWPNIFNPPYPTVAPATQVVEHRHTTAKDNDVKVKVTKAATKEGNYGWEITYESGSTIGVIDTITAADRLLRERFTNG